MSRLLRIQLILSISGSAVVAALIAGLAYSSGLQTVPDVGGAYVEGVVGQPRLFNPLLASSTDYPAQTVDSLVFSGLVKEDASGAPQPDLATSWDVSKGGRTYTFHLRKDVHWHDGQPFTADDVLYTIGAIQSSDFSGDPDLAAAWRDVVINKLDDVTVIVTLPEPFAPILEYATVGILPAHLLAHTPPAELAASSFNHQPIGTGPYRVLHSDLGAVVLEAFGGYYAPKPFISRLMFRYYKDEHAVAQAVLNGDVEGDWHVGAADAPKLHSDGRLAFFQAVQPSFSGIAFNLQDPILSQKQVRQAVAYAIDRETLRARILNGMARVADSPIPPNSWAHDPNVFHYVYDPARARASLQAAGWQQDDQGVWTKDGQPLAPVMLTDDAAGHVALANAVAGQLQQFGIKATVQAVPFDGLVKDFLAPRRFQMALLDWDVSGGDPDPYPLWHSSQAAAEGLNFSGWKNETADGLLEAGRKTAGTAARREAYFRFQSVFLDDLPAFLLFHPVYEYAVDSSVHGVTLPSVVHPWDRFATVSHWYIKTKRVSPLYR
ncbi:MAG: peptide ABC transporter substrate-binding protein [Chloroflexota bacterium]|nr:peptide ABC transporter substrate-binding protein [Chloroflexota bacterium]